MADTLDVLTLAEGRSALNIQSGDTTQDTELASYITAVSRRLDDLCGAIVKRTITAEEYPGGSGVIYLRWAPVSVTATTTISSVSEYTSGSAQALTAETLVSATGNDYAFDAVTGRLTRRSSWQDWRFADQRVVVTYSAGRYATTAAVDAKFKIAASLYLEAIWSASQGVGGSATFGGDIDFTSGNLGLAEARAKILLKSELRPPVVA